MVQLENVTKAYRKRDGEVRALDAVTLSVAEGEFVALKGPSGSGKSTLLLTIGGMVRPTEGRVTVGGTDLYSLSPGKRAAFRAERIGFVFQMFHLIPYLNVLENVLLPTAGPVRRGGRKDALALLERLGLSARIKHRPAELSAGERQRVAMARAVLNKPQLILADEPTGNLDPDSAAQVMDYLTELHQNGKTIILVTHEEVAARPAQRALLLRNGKIG